MDKLITTGSKQGLHIPDEYRLKRCVYCRRRGTHMEDCPGAMVDRFLGPAIEGGKESFAYGERRCRGTS